MNVAGYDHTADVDRPLHYEATADDVGYSMAPGNGRQSPSTIH